MNRRKFMAMMAAGGVVTAAGIWMPGQKLISIPRLPNSVTVTIDGLGGLEPGDYIQFSPEMTASEVMFRQHEYAKQFPELMKAMREDYVNGLYRVMEVAAGE